MYGSSFYHSNKNGCFSCSDHGYFLLLRVVRVVSVVPVAEARCIGWNMADLTFQRNCERQNRFDVMAKASQNSWNY